MFKFCNFILLVSILKVLWVHRFFEPHNIVVTYKSKEIRVITALTDILEGI